MQWLNYHHLLYFWTAARAGSISEAAKELHLSRPTVTGQIRRLESSIGGKLFAKSGKRIVLTTLGALVLRYANDIFATGEELQRALRGGPGETPRLVVGVPDGMPKLVVFRLLEPAFALAEPPRIVCHEGKRDDLLADLALHRLDLVLSDFPLETALSIRAYNHKLGECGVSFFANSKVGPRLRAGFPTSLNGTPMLLPTANSALRRGLDRWFEDLGVVPLIVGEFDDSALLKVFGQAGHGVFPAPAVIEAQVASQYAAAVIGRAPGLRERYFAISGERRIKHPAVLAITSAARTKIFE